MNLNNFIVIKLPSNLLQQTIAENNVVIKSQKKIEIKFSN